MMFSMFRVQLHGYTRETIYNISSSGVAGQAKTLSHGVKVCILLNPEAKVDVSDTNRNGKSQQLAWKLTE